MRRPEDRTLLLDMIDHGRLAVSAAAGRSRTDLDADPAGGGVDHDILLDVVQRDLPPLIARLDRTVTQH